MQEPLEAAHAPAAPSVAVSPVPFATVSPVDGAALESVTATPLDEIPAIVARAREAQRGWQAMSVEQRVHAIARVKDRALDAAEAIAHAVHREVGKPEIEALAGEVLPTADVVHYWCESIEELLASTEIDLDRMAYPGKTGWIHRDARGVVVLITPWNFPVALPLRTLVPALLAGNAVVFKPSEISPRSGAMVTALFDGILPPGVLQMVQGGGEAGAALSASDVDLVVFTGSVATGRRVAHACAERLSPCSIELGGKDAAIVLADANLERAANGVVWGALTNAGQNCASVERVYVERAVVAAFTEKVVAAVKALRPGADVGPLTTRAQCAIVTRHVDEARSAGAAVLVGGDAGEAGHAGYAYAPTVLTVEGDDTALMQDETFGPVIPIAAVDSVDEAVRRANASRFGLTASVWTRSARRGSEIAAQLRAGVVTVNNHAFTGALPGAPWSGHGETGYGITNSPFALEGLTRPRFVLVDRNRARRELWWYPYTPALRTVLTSMAILRSGSRGIFAKVKAVLALLGAMPKRMGGG
jgi:acyl-CoA reductase-like NAD-dependent aldehyde dehydrogenase